MNSTYQDDSRVLHPFIPNNLFKQLSEMSPTNLILLKTFNWIFSFTEVSFADQNFHSLEVEDRIKFSY